LIVRQIRTQEGRELETVTLGQHLAALRRADERFYAERDRRYAEVNVEREKALKIKEEADKAALGLAREIQTYKDEKANELREQINSERGLYVTKTEFEPIKAYIAGQTGQSRGIGMTTGAIVAIITSGAALAGVVALLLR
jgi:hypothetical protein